MGNTHLEEHTKKRLIEFAKANSLKSPSRAVDMLLANDKLLQSYIRENRWLSSLVTQYE